MLAGRAFEPDFLSRLDGLILGTKRARTIRAGRRSVGRVLGSGIEPENFRDYSEGDDLRFLDWNSYARLDDLTIRTYRAERQLELTILIDTSASMALPEDDDKLGIAALLGAALAYVGMTENDSVRLVAFASQYAQRLQSTPFYRRRELYLAFRPFVLALKCGGETRLGEAVAELQRARRQAGIVVLLSDFLVNRLDFEAALGQLVAARHEIKVVQVMGEREASGVYPPGAYRLRDSETGEIREVTFGAQTAAACRRRVEQHAQQLSEFCASHEIVYARACGTAHIEETMAREFPRLGVIA